MRIKSGMPSMNMEFSGCIPGVEEPVKIVLSTGAVEYEVEGDAKELVLHLTSVVSEIKGLIDYGISKVNEFDITGMQKSCDSNYHYNRGYQDAEKEFHVCS